MLKKVNELSMEDYINCVIAYGILELEDFIAWCSDTNIDYEDALEYDWD